MSVNAPAMGFEVHLSVSALRGRDMLCFSHDWNSDPLSKTHLMRLLAQDNRILWVNSIGYRTPSASTADVSRAFKKLWAAVGPLRRPLPNLHVLNPVAIPSHGRAWVRRLNRWLLRAQVRKALRRLGFQRPINWVFNPAAAVIAGQLDEEMLIYYCVDEYAAFAGVPAQALAELEGQLLQRADLVVASSEQLYQSKSKHNPHTVLVRHGVDFAHFRQALAPETPVPADVAGLPRPILGYFGLLAADWVDVDLLVAVARRFPQASLVLIGKSVMDLGALRGLPNVHILGHKPYADLPAYCKAFALGLVPFPRNEATRNANPLKVREYLAAGLPVVSTPVPEVEALGCCYIGGTVDQFCAAIDAALAAPDSRVQRSDGIRHESWENRLEVLGRHIAERQAEQKADRPC